MGDLLLGLWFTALGGIASAMQLRDLRRGFASRRWTVGEAEIVSASVDEHRRGRGGRRHEPRVEYRYVHDGREYQGTLVAFGGVHASTRQEAERLAAHFTPGARLPVNICPTRPELAVLEPGPQHNLWLDLAFFLRFFLFGTHLALTGVRMLFPPPIE